MIGGTAGSLLLWIGIAAGGGAVAGTVLVTSGPLASDDSGGPPVFGAPAVSTAEPTASPPASMPAETPAFTGETLGPDDVYDPATLPAVDTTNWVAHRGPNGTLVLAAPPDWEVRTKDQLDVNGNLIGDAFKVLHVAKLGGQPPRPVGFVPEPGDVWADVATERAPVTITIEGPVFAERTDAETIAGAPSDLHATQTQSAVGYPTDDVAVLTFYASPPLNNGAHLKALVHVALPADLETVAMARELLRRVSTP